MADAKKSTKKEIEAEEAKAKAQENLVEEIAEVAAEEVVAEESVQEETTVAKAGKRSAKSIKEAEEKEAKEARKASGEEADEKPKAPVKPARSRLERRGKHFRDSAKHIEAEKAYPLAEAVALAKKTSHVKFDATVELHINLAVDPRHADQNIRDNLILPAGTGKSVRVAVLTEDAAEAKKAGADIAGAEELFAQLDKGVMDFDVLISTPALMAQLGKYARTLGPRGLMPNPKSGTVTNDINRAIAESKAGRVEYRVDSTGIVHLGVGKVSFSEAQLNDNIQAVFTSVKSNKPSSIKNAYIKAVHLTTSMGPSIIVDLASVN